MSSNLPPEEGSPSDLNLDDIVLGDDELTEIESVDGTGLDEMETEQEIGDSPTDTDQDSPEPTEAEGSDEAQKSDEEEDAASEEGEGEGGEEEEDEDGADEEKKKGMIATLLAGEANLYTVLLSLSLLFIVVSCLLMYTELSSYASTTYWWWDVSDGIPNTAQ